MTGLSLRDIVKTGAPTDTRTIDSALSAQITKYYGAAVVTAFLCDYLETFPSEVNYMWKSNGNRWNMARVLFFLCRYVTMGQIPLLYTLFIPNLSNQTCSNMQAAFITVSWLVEVFPLAIMLLCMYALFESRRSLAPVFIGSYVVIMSVLLATSVVFIVNSIVPPPEERRGGCFTYQNALADNVMLGNRLVRLAAHLVMVVLASWRGWTRYKKLKSPLMKAIYEGGMLYYGGVFVMAVADVSARYYAPTSAGDPLRLKIVVYLGRFGAPILANRLLLRMYKQVHVQQETGVVRSMSGLRFDSGNVPRTYLSGAESGIGVKFTKTYQTQTDVATVRDVSHRHSTGTTRTVDTKVSKGESSFAHAI